MLSFRAGMENYSRQLRIHRAVRDLEFQNLFANGIQAVQKTEQS